MTATVDDPEPRSGVVGRLSPRAVALIAWSVCALSLALTAPSLLLLNLNLSQPEPHIFDSWLDNTLNVVFFSTVGALIASRRPENPVGWLLCLFGLSESIQHFGAEYAIYALLAQPNSLPAGEAMAWIVSWILPVIIGLSVFYVLLFPTGRLPSTRWRLLAWLTVALILVGAISGALCAGPVDGLGPIRNPLGIEGFTSVCRAVVYTMSAVLLVAAVSSVFMRLRRATGIERQQIKWFAYAAAATVVGLIVAYVIPGVTDTPLWFERAGYAIFIALIPAMPLSIGIAILRYRLYDIDLLINRTLVYASLTATLVALYLGTVVLLQRLFVLLTGDESTLAVVVSTLVIAALFNPSRRRVQSFIDRRFYRRKYDARRTLEAFGTRLRDETSLDALREDLVEVVGQTMQPAHVSLWLRPDTAAAQSEARSNDLSQTFT